MKCDFFPVPEQNRPNPNYLWFITHNFSRNACHNIFSHLQDIYLYGKWKSNHRVLILVGYRDCFKGGEHLICLPDSYQKYDLPSQHDPNKVYIEVHIKDIPKVSDKDFSITLDAYFNVKWQDKRLVSTLFRPGSNRSISGPGAIGDKFSMTAVNVNILPKLWIPDLEIMDLMSFETHKILSKLEGISAKIII